MSQGLDPPRTPVGITVSMSGALVVVRPRGYCDDVATGSLVAAVAAAVRSGASVLVDLAGATVGNPGGGTEVEAAANHAGAAPVDGGDRGATVAAVAPGYVRLTSGTGFWTVDLRRHRLCRSATPVDPRFVTGAGWTGLRALWATPTVVSALTADDTIMSVPVTWVAEADTAIRAPSAA